jgi:hypothetical protein
MSWKPISILECNVRLGMTHTTRLEEVLQQEEGDVVEPYKRARARRDGLRNRVGGGYVTDSGTQRRVGDYLYICTCIG